MHVKMGVHTWIGLNKFTFMTNHQLQSLSMGFGLVSIELENKTDRWTQSVSEFASSRAALA